MIFFKNWIEEFLRILCGLYIPIKKKLAEKLWIFAEFFVCDFIYLGFDGIFLHKIIITEKKKAQFLISGNWAKISFILSRAYLFRKEWIGRSTR